MEQLYIANPKLRPDEFLKAYMKTVKLFHIKNSQLTKQDHNCD